MMSVSRSQRLRQVLAAGVFAFLGGLVLVGTGHTARADGAPYCWGPYYNTVYDCPDYSAASPGMYYLYDVHAPPYAYPYLYPWGY